MTKPLATGMGDPTISLAPMAGITDLPFRQLVGQFGADRITSEMVASQEVVQAKPGMREKAELGLAQAQTAVQLVGRDPHWMAEAARFVAGQGAQIIDINMGCPAKKVVGGLSGSALMRDLDLALRLIEAVAEAVDVPVTLKTRLGWDDDSLNAPELARRAEAAGVQQFVIHGRTRCQFYKGHADWAAIGAVVAAVEVPVIANGDIIDLATARRALAQSGAAGVMIGRGAQGRPWLLAEIAHGLTGARRPKSRAAPRWSIWWPGITRRCWTSTARRWAARRPQTSGLVHGSRRHPAALRREVLTATRGADILRLLPEALAEREALAA